MRRLRLSTLTATAALVLVPVAAGAQPVPPPPGPPPPPAGDGSPPQAPSTPHFDADHAEPEVARPDAGAADRGSPPAQGADWAPPVVPEGLPRFIDSDDPRYDLRYDGVCVATLDGAFCYGPAIDPPATDVWDRPPSSAALRREAVRIIHSEPLPGLAPRINPGWGITGKQMFLETGATMTLAPQTRETAFGPLRLAAASVVYVDWGDGIVTGPYHEPGLPWPHGHITHAWRDAGTYWVVTWQYWAVNWRLDWQALVRTWELDEDGNEVEGDPEPVSGTLTGQELLTGMNWIPDGFRVRDLQAVRTS